jgi:hypothetical protein
MSKIPTAVRAFLGTAIGSETSITEKDFSEEELKFIANQIKNREQKNTKEKEDYSFWLNWMKENPPRPDEHPMMVESYNKRLNEVQKAVDSYKTTEGKTSVQYDDYDNKYRQEQFGIFDTVKSLFMSPEYNVQKTLGRYNAFKDEEGNVIVSDTYDWTKPSRTISFREFVSILPEILTKPESAGNVFMRLIQPERSRNVEIKLNKGMFDEH